jgi:hypothetical protein
VTFEQWLQVVGPILLSGTAMIGGATWFLAARIERLYSISGRLSEMAPHVGDLLARMAVAEQRINSIEQLMVSRSRDEADFRTEIRAMVGQMMRGVT